MPRSAYPLAMDAAPQDGRWLDDPGAVKTALMFFIGKLSPADRDELDGHLTEGTTPQAQDHRLPECDLRRDLLKYTPRNRRGMLAAGADIRRARGSMTLDEMKRADPDYSKTLDERFPNLHRLKGGY